MNSTKKSLVNFDAQSNNYWARCKPRKISNWRTRSYSVNWYRSGHILKLIWNKPAQFQNGALKAGLSGARNPSFCPISVFWWIPYVAEESVVLCRAVFVVLHTQQCCWSKEKSGNNEVHILASIGLILVGMGVDWLGLPDPAAFEVLIELTRPQFWGRREASIPIEAS